MVLGILRVSGPKAVEVAQAVLGKCPKPRMADYLPFKDADGTVLDQGIALYFKSPNSFTGEMYWNCKVMADKWY